MNKPTPFKVCYFLKRYPRLSETFVVNEMQELQRQGIDVTVVAQRSADEELIHQKTAKLKVPIYYMPPVRLIPNEASSMKFLDSLNASPCLIGREILSGDLSKADYRTLIESAMIAPFIQKLGINLIHAHFATWATTAASTVSRITGIPYSFTAHAKDIYHESVDKSSLAEKMAHARFVVTVSDFNKRYLDECLKSEEKTGRVIRLYNGIDLDQFCGSEEEKEPGLIVGVGRLVPKKGFEYLIQACNILNKKGRDFRCLIIGEGEERNPLAKNIARYSLKEKVKLMGARPQEEVKKILKKAAVFALPCIVGDDGNRDGLPTVILEAMALGVAIVSTKVTGIPEMISDQQSGFLVKEKNPDELAHAIDILLGSEMLRNNFVKAASEKVHSDFNVIENVRTLKNYFLSEKT